jgi:hypothetical protein
MPGFPLFYLTVSVVKKTVHFFTGSSSGSDHPDFKGEATTSLIGQYSCSTDNLNDNI